ncbi:MAG: DUF2911 domain-containing protein [Gemmatimonadota bacterium]
MPLLPAAFLVVALFTPQAAEAQQSYGLISRLGRDTVVVERITRTGDKVVGDIIERSPRVVQRHYEATLKGDGSIELYVLDTKVLNPDAGRPSSSHLQAHFAGTEMHLNTSNNVDTTVKSSTIPYTDALAMPWLLYGPGSYEMIFAAALKRSGDSIPVGAYSPGGRAVSHNFIKRLANGGASIDFFGTPIVAKVSAQGQLLSMSAAATTIKLETMRLAKAPDIEAIAARFAATEKAAGPAAALSVRDTARATVGTAALLVDYGRPLTRGRTILGNVVPLGEVWRTGANAATQFTTSTALTIGGLDVAPGTYTLWTLPTASGVQLIVNKQTKQWGTEYHAEQDLGRVAVTTEKLGAPVEKFTMSIVPVSATTGKLVIEWDTFRWAAPIVVR